MVFQPEWFKTNKLLRDNEVEHAKISVIHPTITQFTAGTFKITAQENRFTVETVDQSNFEPLKDLALSVTTLLSAIPVSQAGINFSAHLQCNSEETWHELGHFFTPKSFWSGIIDKPGMQSLTIEGTAELSEFGYIRTKIEPSTSVTRGIFVHINNHCVFKDAIDSRPFVDTLEQSWKKGLSNSLKTFKAVSDKIAEIEAKK